MKQERVEACAANRAEAPLPHVRAAPADAPHSWPSPQAWDALARDASDPNPFFERWFLAPGLTLIGAGAGAELLLCESEGTLIGLMPVIRRRSYYGHPLPHLSVWLHNNAFCGTPLVRRGFEHDFWRTVLAWADQNAALALFLHLPHVPADGRVHAALCAALDGSPRAGMVVHRSERAMLRSDASAEDYFAGSVSAKKRKELRRQHNRLSELGALTFTRTAHADGIAEWIEDYLTLEAKGWKGADGSALAQHPANAQIFRTALTGAAGLGRLERLTLRLDGKPIAMLANFLVPPGVFSFKTAYDESYARFSPGVLLQRENLDLLGRPGIAWADSCAAADHPMIERIWREKRTITHISLAIGGRARQALGAGVFHAERGTPLTAERQEN